MATYRAIHAVCHALVGYLEGSFPPGLVPGSVEFQLLSSPRQATATDLDNVVSIWLYRVTTNEHARGFSSAGGGLAATTPLAVDLHLLLTVWATDAEAEHTLLAWTMSQLFRQPALDLSMLSTAWTPPGQPHPHGFARNEVITVVQEEMSTEDLMRVWDALSRPYRLSVPYVVRVVTIDAEVAEAALPVRSAQFDVGAIGSANG